MEHAKNTGGTIDLGVLVVLWNTHGKTETLKCGAMVNFEITILESNGIVVMDC